jgi:hypothetical protein
MIIPYVTIDGNRYAVAQGSYSRQWQRSFTSYLAANIVRLNYIDKGPGVRTYSMQLQMVQWPPSSQPGSPYNNGITASPEAQMAQIEATYAKIATPVSFTDPFGNTSTYGVFMTDLQQTIPNWATTEQTFILATVQLTEATQTVN